VSGAQHRLRFGDLFVAALDVRHAATTARSAWISAKVKVDGKTVLSSTEEGIPLYQ
jgi:hypothetical protein